AHRGRREAGDREGRKSVREVDLDGHLVRIEPALTAAQQPRERHVSELRGRSPGNGRTSPATSVRSLPGRRASSLLRRRASLLLRRRAPRGHLALELREPRLERLELLAGALEHGALHVELLTRDEIHALDAGVQQRSEVALQIVAERTKVLRER